MKKIIVFLMFLCCTTIFGPKAEASEILDAKYQVIKNQIELSWKAEADKYQLYKDGVLTWEGTKNTYQDKDVQEDYSYNYILIALVDEKPVDVAEFKITTDKSENVSLLQQRSNLDNQENHILDDTKIESVATDSYVKLKLSGNIPDEDNTLEVYRDDEYLGVLEGNEFEDKNVEPGVTYSYSFIGRKQISESQQKEIREYLNANNINLSEEELNEAFMKPYEVRRVVEVPKSDIIKTINEITPMYDYEYKYVFRYKTFIDRCKVDAASMPLHDLLGYEFGGDCRGFSFSSNAYRTKVETAVSFTNSGSSIDTSMKDVGWSYLYDKHGNLKEAMKASSAGIKYSNISKTSSRVNYHINHDVSIPFGQGPGINYYYNAVVYANGSFTLTGSRDQAPHHELYVYVANSDIPFLTVFQSPNKGFSYLAPPMPDAEIKEMY